MGTHCHQHAFEVLPAIQLNLRHKHIAYAHSGQGNRTPGLARQWLAAEQSV